MTEWTIPPGQRASGLLNVARIKLALLGEPFPDEHPDTAVRRAELVARVAALEDAVAEQLRLPERRDIE